MGNTGSNSHQRTKSSKRQKKKTVLIIQKLKEFEELLQKKIEFIDSQIDKELSTAKRHGKKNKRAAFSALKRKHRLESKLEKLEGTLATLELQREALESAGTNAEILRVMNQANDALKKAHQNIDLDAVNTVLDEAADHREISQELSNAISSPVGFNEDFDEDDLMKELQDLIQEDKFERDEEERKSKQNRNPALLADHHINLRHKQSPGSYKGTPYSIPVNKQFILSLPSVPQGDPDDLEKNRTRSTKHKVQKSATEEEELKRLQMWAA